MEQAGGHQLNLTRQEERVLLHSVGGISDIDIAQRLAISEATVKRYWSSICRKAGQSRSVLLARLVRGGIAGQPILDESSVGTHVAEVAALRAAELRFEAMASASPFGIFVVDPSHRCTYVNPAWSKITGLSFEQANAGKWEEIVHPEDRKAVMAAWQESAAQELPFHSVYRVIRFDGSEAHIVVRATALRSGGHHLGYLGTVENLSHDPDLHEMLAATNQELSRIEQRLYATEARFRTFMDKLPGISFIKDSEGRLVYASKAFDETFGFPSSLVIGKTDLEYLPRSVAKRTRRMERDLLKEGSSATSIEVDHSVVGSRRWLIHRFVFQEGGASLIGGTSFDVTNLWEAEERFRAFAEASVDGLVLFQPVRDDAGKVTDFAYSFFNPSAKRFYGDDCQALIGKRILETALQAHGKRLVKSFGKVFAGETSFQAEIRSQIPHSKGRLLLVQAVKAGESLAVCMRDLTDERLIQARLRETEERHRVALQSMHQGVFLVDAQGRIVASNRAAHTIFGCQDRELLGISIFAAPWRVIDARGKRILRKDRPIQRALEGVPSDSVEQNILRPDGSQAWIRISCQPIYLKSSGKPDLAVTTFVDISREVIQRERLKQNLVEINSLNVQLAFQKEELEAANRQLTILATTDRLTGLLNHGKFKQVLEEEFERSRRYKRSLSMVLLDVDRFKSFNDTFGHLVGDEVLTMVGKTIQANQRTTDLGARYGGEEFAVLLPETRANQAMVVGERLRAAVERLDVPYRQVTISVGVCTLTKQFGNSSEFLAAADRALYEAKNAGRNQVVQAKPALLARAA